MYMGGAKNQMMMEDEQGWSSVDKNVCPDCLAEPALADAVRSAADDPKCDYCNQYLDGAPIAAPVDVVLEAIVDGIRTEYGNPDDEGVMYISAEGGYTMPIFDGWDLVMDLGITENDDLVTDLSQAISGQWCRRNPYHASEAEALSWGWGHFRKHVTHTTRYMFHIPASDAARQRADGEIPPEDMLGALAETIRSGGLTSMLPVGTRWWRVRPHGTMETPSTAKELGSPPSEYAKTNRMSAAGISAFYGASTFEGAVAEVAGYVELGSSATIGLWETVRPMLVINLVDLPEMPSLFDPKTRHLRPDLQFLHGFTADATRPARPDDKQNLDYVPTQIVAEYLNQVYRDDDANPVMGVLWRSTKDPAVTNCVLFVDNDGCADQDDLRKVESGAWIQLIPESIQRGRFIHSGWAEDKAL